MGGQGETGFGVEPAALHELAALLDRARQHVDGARKYLAKMEEFEGGEGLLGGCLEGHRAAYDALGGWLDRIADPALAETSGAMSDSARYYETTDRETAANLDATCPATDVDRAREQAGTIPIESEGTPWFGDAADPRRYLNEEPGDYHEQLATKMSWWDATSAMSWAGEAIETVSNVAVWLSLLDRPYHPQERLVQPFIGDWAGARAASDVLRAVGRAVNSVATNIQWGAQSAERVWQGNAADAAVAYLTGMARPLDTINAWPPIDAMATQYEEASADMVGLRDAAVGTINAIGDAAVEAAVACGVVGGSASSGVGTPIAAAAALFAGYKIHRVVDGINDLLGIVSDLNNVTSALKAAQDEFADIGRPVLPSLPSAPISTPGT
jgi:hypothetical protein